MTSRAIRRIRRPSSLKPGSSDSSPALARTYRVWGRLRVRYRRWCEAGRQGGCPVDLRWLTCFDDFYADVGLCPEGHCPKPLRPGEPLGPDNYRLGPSHQKALPSTSTAPAATAT